jgi:hypothetical protein
VGVTLQGCDRVLLGEDVLDGVISDLVNDDEKKRQQQKYQKRQRIKERTEFPKEEQIQREPESANFQESQEQESP